MKRKKARMTFKSSRGGSSEPKHLLQDALFQEGGAVVCQRPAPAGRPLTISVESYCLGERGPARGDQKNLFRRDAACLYF